MPSSLGSLSEANRTPALGKRRADQELSSSPTSVGSIAKLPSEDWSFASPYKRRRFADLETAEQRLVVWRQNPSAGPLPAYPIVRIPWDSRMVSLAPGASGSTPDAMLYATQGLAAGGEPFCGIVASGRPVVTHFQPIGGNKFTCAIANPALVPELSVFLLPAFQSAAAQGFGLSIFWCKDGANWQLLGSISGNKPSDIFRTGWPADPELAGCEVVQVGVAVEPLQSIEAAEGHGSPGVGRRLHAAHGIAKDLFNYMQSFTQRHQIDGKDYLVLPTDVFNRWMSRFERKYQRDPTFFIKES